MRLFDFATVNFDSYRPKNNDYIGFAKYKMRIEFRKVRAEGKIIGYRQAEILLSPHYHFNDYKHNANIFTVQNAIDTFKVLFKYLGISPNIYNLYRVVMMEFGFNIIPFEPTETVIDLASFYMRKNFIATKNESMNFKITDTDKTKEWKIYYKGLQFPEVNDQTLRIEIRLKKTRTINAKTKIKYAGDLLKIESYDSFFSFYINDYDNIFFCEDEGIFNSLKNDIATGLNRNNWTSEKNKYLKNKPRLSAIKSKIKSQLIDTYLSFR